MRSVLPRPRSKREKHHTHQRGRCQTACNEEPEATSLRACQAVGDQGGDPVPQETEIVGFIQEMLTQVMIPIEFQKSAATYRTDLHAPTLKLAIETDENNHADRDPSYEQAREEPITGELGCKFLRINPDASDFKLSSCVGRIMREIIHGTHD